jgi:hypothetical protein
MSTLKSRIGAPTSTAEIQRRGRALQERFRIAGIPQYTRWLIDHEPGLGTEVDTMVRMRYLFNGQGARRDADLLVKCEGLAERHLPKAAA